MSIHRAALPRTHCESSQTNPEGEARVTFPAAKAVFDFLGVGEKVGVAIRNSWHCDIFG